jgi:hypothetical protein
MKSKRNRSEIIRSALNHLLERPSGAFVIIEETNSGKFVQFNGSEEEPLMFDLPQQALTFTEFKNAKILFKESGYPSPQTYDVYEYPGGPSASTQTGFNVTFGKDVEKATLLAVAVFENIYKIDVTSELKLTEK